MKTIEPIKGTKDFQIFCHECGVQIGVRKPSDNLALEPIYCHKCSHELAEPLHKKERKIVLQIEKIMENRTACGANLEAGICLDTRIRSESDGQGGINLVCVSCGEHVWHMTPDDLED
jgi:hypothetical protein